MLLIDSDSLPPPPSSALAISVRRSSGPRSKEIKRLPFHSYTHTHSQGPCHLSICLAFTELTHRADQLKIDQSLLPSKVHIVWHVLLACLGVAAAVAFVSFRFVSSNTCAYLFTVCISSAGRRGLGLAKQIMIRSRQRKKQRA